MAFFAENGQQCRTHWVDNLGLVEPLPADVPAWRVLPTDFDRLCERVAVDGVGFFDRQALFCHPDLEEHGRSVALAVRLQGIVADVKINPTGNWTGQPDGAARAVQWITLTSGGNDRVFRPQREGVAHLEEIIRSMVGGNSSVRHPNDGTLRLQRRVFTKVRPDDAGTAVILSKQEDPQGRVSKMARDWIVDHRIKTWVRTVQGQYGPVNALAIRKGDLVDVLTVIDIVTMKGKGGRRVEVHFSPQEIVRLESAQRMHINAKRIAESVQHVTVAKRKQVVVESFGVEAEHRVPDDLEMEN